MRWSLALKAVALGLIVAGTIVGYAFLVSEPDYLIWAVYAIVLAAAPLALFASIVIVSSLINVLILVFQLLLDGARRVAGLTSRGAAGAFEFATSEQGEQTLRATAKATEVGMTGLGKVLAKACEGVLPLFSFERMYFTRVAVIAHGVVQGILIFGALSTFGRLVRIAYIDEQQQTVYSYTLIAFCSSLFLIVGVRLFFEFVLLLWKMHEELVHIRKSAYNSQTNRFDSNTSGTF